MGLQELDFIEFLITASLNHLSLVSSHENREILEKAVQRIQSQLFIHLLQIVAHFLDTLTESYSKWKISRRSLE